MSNEYFTAARRQFISASSSSSSSHVAEVQRFRPGSGDGSQIFDPQQVAVFVCDRASLKGSGSSCGKGVMRLRATRKSSQSHARWHQQAIGSTVRRRLLHDVLGVGGIGTRRGEIAKPGRSTATISEIDVLLDHRVTLTGPSIHFC